MADSIPTSEAVYDWADVDILMASMPGGLT